MKRLFLKTPIALCIIAMSFGLTSCLDEGTNGEDPYKRLAKEVAEIDLALGLTSNVIKDPSGIRIVVNQLGTGLPANLSNKIDVDYTGRLFSTDDVFDEGTANQKLSQYIAGWKLAFSILPAGTLATLYIPSGYGYGNRANGQIPANSILKFSVKFNEIIETTTEDNQLKTDTLAIDNYIATKAITDVVKDSTGLRYKITQAGTGDNATWYDQITMNYKIYLMSNDANPVITIEREPSEAFASRLVDYIHGMKVGLSKMNVGSKATLYIPSGLAFGPDGASNSSGGLAVPPNSNIIIEIEVEDIDYRSL
jgi:peptidylprolyl isomerase